MEKSDNVNPQRETAEDKAVQKMIETWDIVNCKYCGKEISMLDSHIVRDSSGEYFVCKEHIHE